MRGRRFLHPRLGFTFTAPDGFARQHRAGGAGRQAWRRRGAAARRRARACRADARRISDFRLDREHRPGTVEEITINGFPGATATAKGDQWDFRLYAVRFGSDVYRFIFAAKHRTPETDRLFRDSIGTFRRMSLAEIEDAKPLRLQVVTVAPSDTVEKLADRMAVADRRSNASACSTDSTRRPAEVGQRSQDRG